MSEWQSVGVAVSQSVAVDGSQDAIVSDDDGAEKESSLSSTTAMLSKIWTILETFLPENEAVLPKTQSRRVGGMCCGRWTREELDRMPISELGRPPGEPNIRTHGRLIRYGVGAPRPPDPTKCSAHGEGLVQAMRGKENVFVVRLRAKNGLAVSVDASELHVVLLDENDRRTEGSVQPHSVETGTYLCTYTLSQLGEHRISVTIFGSPIPGSPFTVTAVPSQQLPPTPPSNFSVAFSADALVFTWNKTDQSILEWKIESAKTSDPSWTSHFIDGDETSMRWELSHNAILEYQFCRFRISARNRFGWGRCSTITEIPRVA